MAAADEPSDHDQHDAPADPFGRPASPGGSGAELHHGDDSTPGLSQGPASAPASAAPAAPNASSIPAGGPRYAGAAPAGGPRYAGRPTGPGGPNFAGSVGATTGTTSTTAQPTYPTAPTAPGAAPTGSTGQHPGMPQPAPYGHPVAGAAGAPGVVGGPTQPAPAAARFSPTAATLGMVPTYAPTAAERGPQRLYKEFATSPLWAALAAIACYVFGWAALVSGLAADISSYDTFDSARTDASTLTYVALFLFFCGWLAMILWLYQIGNNASTYGGGLLLGIAVYPFTAILFALAGWVGVLAYYLIYFLWPARLLSSGIWKAGRLPPLFAILGWAPAALGITMAVLGAQADLPILALLGTIGLVVTAVWWPVTLVAVTIIQHLGIAQDRRQRNQARVA